MWDTPVSWWVFHSAPVWILLEHCPQVHMPFPSQSQSIPYLEHYLIWQEPVIRRNYISWSWINTPVSPIILKLSTEDISLKTIWRKEIALKRKLHRSSSLGNSAVCQDALRLAQKRAVYGPRWRLVFCLLMRIISSWRGVSLQGRLANATWKIP